MSGDRDKDRLTILELEYQVVAGRLATIDGELQVIKERLGGIEAAVLTVRDDVDSMLPDVRDIPELRADVREAMIEIRAMHTEVLRRLGGDPT